jgi:thioredoxin reductase (NADPH)
VRFKKLPESMSQYLIARIEAHPQIEIRYLTQIVALLGTAHLERIEWKDDSSGIQVTRPIRHVFVMAGAAPRTEWLQDSFILDNKGFIVTGPDLVEYDELQWPLSRAPLLRETGVPGIFAVGDAPSGSVKRVASAVGEGAMAVHLVHRFLADSTSVRTCYRIDISTSPCMRCDLPETCNRREFSASITSAEGSDLTKETR